MKITAITPTSDRPAAFALCEGYMARQTVAPAEWIVADGGAIPTPCTMGQIHIHDPRPAGAENFGRNLLNAIARASGDVVVVIEDDDWYARDHVQTVAGALERNPMALLAGDDRQQYYNVAARCWRTFHNVGASLCQTAMRRGAIPLFQAIIYGCLKRASYGIDTTLWRAVATAQWSITGKVTALGIKGLPGQVGLGIGHRPAGPGWTSDPDGAQLKAWIGNDAATYLSLGK